MQKIKNMENNRAHERGHGAVCPSPSPDNSRPRPPAILAAVVTRADYALRAYRPSPAW